MQKVFILKFVVSSYLTSINIPKLSTNQISEQTKATEYWDTQNGRRRQEILIWKGINLSFILLPIHHICPIYSLLIKSWFWITKVGSKIYFKNKDGSLYRKDQDIYKNTRSNFTFYWLHPRFSPCMFGIVFTLPTNWEQPHQSYNEQWNTDGILHSDKIVPISCKQKPKHLINYEYNSPNIYHKAFVCGLRLILV